MAAKFRYIFLSVICLSAFILFPLGSAWAVSGVVNCTLANLRQAPGTGSPIISTLPAGTTATILESKDGWYRIKSDQLQGWINGTLLDINKDETQLTVNSDLINLRVGPGTSYAIAGQAHKGDLLTWLDTQGQWYKVKNTQGLSVFVLSSLVDKAESQPVAVPAMAEASGTVIPDNSAEEIHPKVLYNGSELQFDVPPIIQQGRTLVPLRAIFEAMGATVDWNQTTQTVTAKKDAITVVLSIGSGSAKINGVDQSLDVPAQILNNRTLAPLRFVGEAFGGQVDWEQSTSTITISTAVISPVTPSTPIVPNTPALKISTASDADGLKLIMASDNAQTSSITDEKEGYISLLFKDRHIEGDSTLSVAIGRRNITMKAVNEGDNLRVNINIPAGIAYRKLKSNEGRQDIIVVDNSVVNSIVGVQRTTFGSGGEKMVVKTSDSVDYTVNYQDKNLQVTLSNVKLGSASSYYSYDSQLISAVNLNQITDGSNKNIVLNIKTSDDISYSLAQSDGGTTLNILFISKKAVQNNGNLIFIDPGHGGKDPGAHGQTLKEKDVNLDIALKLGKLLTQQGYTVQYSRTDDTLVSLESITSMANLYKPKLFVSLHCNASTSSGPQGTETYFYAPLDIPELFVQKTDRENLATLIQQKLTAKIGRPDRGVKQTNFWVIKYTQMPSCLVEMAFISNPEEEALLGQDSFRNTAAQGIADGISAYLNNH